MMGTKRARIYAAIAVAFLLVSSLVVAIVSAIAAPPSAQASIHYVGGGDGSQQTVPVVVTFYGFNDNSGATESQHGSTDIAYPKKGGYPTLHNLATEGLGTYNDPVTFAVRPNDQTTFPIGSIAYFPLVHKYFIMEDECGDTDPQGCLNGTHHTDLWLGPQYASDSTALENCENNSTPGDSVLAVINPSSTFPVDTTPMFQNNQCTMKLYDGNIVPPAGTPTLTCTVTSTPTGTVTPPPTDTPTSPPTYAMTPPPSGTGTPPPTGTVTPIPPCTMTPTPTNTPTPTPTPTPTNTPTPPPSSGITNGGFEAGDFSGWSTTGTTSISHTAHGGNDAAQVGTSTPTNGDSSIQQTFTAPSGTSSLTFWYDVHCLGATTSDWVTARLKDNTTGITSIILPKTCSNDNTWFGVSASVTAGHSYTLILTSHDGGRSRNSIYTLFDDVIVV